jgi:hypothetical protein
MMPPSPLLSARRISATYLKETTTISDQNTSERMPSTFSGVIGTGWWAAEDFLDGIQRAGADVAIDHAERGQGEDGGAVFLFFVAHGTLSWSWKR